MKPFIHEDFLLHSKAAKILFHDYAKDMPIYDYHCHLSPKEIAENKSFGNLAEIWLHGDHYKWRAMRSFGIPEPYITGEKNDYEKFKAWAKTVPNTIGNPLYHWSHLELKRYFQTDLLLSEDTSEEVWNHCNELLQTPSFSPRQLIEKSNVKVVGTTDDPIDDLHYHQIMKENSEFKTKVVPTFRPDQAIELTKSTFNEYVDKLAEVSEVPIKNYEELLGALDNRAHYFHEVGCRISDHGLEMLPFEECTFEEASKIFLKVRQGEAVTFLEEMKYKTHTILFLGRLYHSLGWAMQLHVGAIRDNSERMHALLGANTGFDSIHDFSLARQLNGFLNELDKTNELPKTIVYSLNPVHNYVIATACGNFQSEVKGKVQFGSGWWFNDQKDGMLRQMTDLSNLGLLSTFIGMLTDSRSFLSYTRHEYFRRILCQLIGGWVEKGEAPEDYKHLGEIVQSICYNNAKEYFQIEVD
ncbi:glucuronate isomerase [Anaerobacillus sp. CMMVII]|uniref:glucuronate isomerase n=1 Tax=Anaerobacillus sp. CMMVII TaxID=2755588 RepID=UPI0021B817B1|nr:glucuronate isomerase [Anaerobacillus sp. CMMVII]MCT8137118.1 glucuronate isomerase [Anaerobacillus sp. CMMVII]